MNIRIGTADVVQLVLGNGGTSAVRVYEQVAPCWFNLWSVAWHFLFPNIKKNKGVLEVISS
jgi:hypothetical protein